MTNELQELPRQLERTISIPPKAAEIDLGGDIREFMIRPPHWLLRSGTTVLAAVLGLLLLLSVIIKYPDTIVGRVNVTGMQPVMEVVARQGGHLESLRVREGQRVRQGEILAVMQSAARPATVFARADKLRELQSKIAQEKLLIDVSFEPRQDLGNLQSQYADFLNAY